MLIRTCLSDWMIPVVLGGLCSLYRSQIMTCAPSLGVILSQWHGSAGEVPIWSSGFQPLLDLSLNNVVESSLLNPRWWRILRFGFRVYTWVFELNHCSHVFCCEVVVCFAIQLWLVPGLGSRNVDADFARRSALELPGLLLWPLIHPTYIVSGVIPGVVSVVSRKVSHR